ncbi:MAG: HAMP domain-containing histidine kinase [Sandaracinaceae bacterium]|nr:HAMP domain-containing histidine kinase [Myxococcales bacterium]MCB9656049.1 HAMP domain-containing histidine kinase [Sandaracinaceae bacterium]
MATGPSDSERDVHGRTSRSTKTMRLLTRLLLSHAAPVLVVTLAFSLVLVAVVRIRTVLTTLSTTELLTLRDEGTVHRAAWELDVQLRRAESACAQGEGASQVEPRISRSADTLEARLSEAAAVSQTMREVARGYLAIADEMIAGDACQAFVTRSIQRRRWALDEQMTDVWVLRLAELHTAMGQKDEQARQDAVTAIWIGIPLAALSFALAMLLAAHLARDFKRPLATLSGMARRVGRGDFGSPVSVEGPPELVALADELERMRAQLQQLEMLKQGFLASVSHELRTPLSKIREALALLSDGAVGELEPRQVRVVQIARTACEREIRMVTTLLDLSRLRAGSPLRLANGGSLIAVVQSAVADEGAEATARGVHIELTVAADSDRCRLDPVLMERAVANLVRNAVSVSRRGQRVDVRVVRAAGHEGRDGLCVTVADEGPGVPPAIRATIFDVFVTHEVPSSGKAIGVGIGLALAREVVQAHGGTLTLTEAGDEGASERQVGACFALWLPLDEGTPPEPNPPHGLLGFSPATS